MTKKQRAEVVELLRCAAAVQGIAYAFELLTGIETTGAHCQPGGRANYPTWDLAVRSREFVELNSDINRGGCDRYRWTCLEAAQRVEDGDWP